MSDSPEATRLLDRWRSGDEDAADALFQLYSRRLTGIAEQHLSRPLARRVDSDDVVQSAFRTFFRRGRRGDFRIDDSAGLWRLLVKITLAKVCSQARRHTSPKRDVRAESPFLAGDPDAALLAREPGPDEAAMLVDLMHVAIDGLPGTYAEILGQRLAGHSRSEIAANLQIARQTVYRALRVMQQRLGELMDDGADGRNSE